MSPIMSNQAVARGLKLNPVFSLILFALEYTCYMSDLRLCFVRSSQNNDRTVGGKTLALGLLGMMPSISKAVTMSQTDEWQAERQTRLYN